MSASPLPESSPKILVIEDEYDHLELLSYALNKYAVTLRLAQSGLDGWKILQNERIDLVILDYSLPDLDGLTLLKRIRALTRKHPVVMLTTHNEHWLKEEAGRSGVNYLIHKTAVGSFLTKLGEIVAHEFGLRKRAKPPALLGVRDFTEFLRSANN